VTDAAATYAAAGPIVRSAFPTAIPASDYIAWTVSALDEYGLTPERTLPILVTCRDEVLSDLKALVGGAWGLTFSGTSLGGAFTMGRTGFQAAWRHIPEAELPLRLAVFIFPHIGVDRDGTIGSIHRQGRANASQACGAIISMHQEFKSGATDLSFDSSDPEMSLLRQGVAPYLLGRPVPDLVALTEIVRDVAVMDLLKTGVANAGEVADLALFSGILINGPDETSWVLPDLANLRHHDDSELVTLVPPNSGGS